MPRTALNQLSTRLKQCLHAQGPGDRALSESDAGFPGAARHRGVECTFAWLGSVAFQARCQGKNHEGLPDTAEAGSTLPCTSC